MRQNSFLVGLLLVVLTWNCLALSQNEAQPSGEAWLVLVDKGKYGESWSEASAFFRSRVPAQKWTEMVSGVREPLGAKTLRKLKSISFPTSLPGAPDGNYALIQFDASFARKANAVETLTLMEDAGKWRVAGYFIK
jgi:hypothetical protein